MNDRYKVLIVDDSMVDRELASLMLSENNFEVFTVESGIEILNIIAIEKPDIVLLDILMPVVDGNETLRIIRRKYTELELPVIMITSKSDAADVVASLKRGANDFITKPVNFEIALRRIHTQLQFVAQSKAMYAAKELAALNAMAVTYNHEINNPLYIALGSVELIKEKEHDSDLITALEGALFRIADVVKKTKEVLAKGTIEFEKYEGNIKMLKISDEKNKK